MRALYVPVRLAATVMAVAAAAGCMSVGDDGDRPAPSHSAGQRGGEAPDGGSAVSGGGAGFHGAKGAEGDGRFAEARRVRVRVGVSVRVGVRGREAVREARTEKDGPGAAGGAGADQGGAESHAYDGGADARAAARRRCRSPPVVRAEYRGAVVVGARAGHAADGAGAGASGGGEA